MQMDFVLFSTFDFLCSLRAGIFIESLNYDLFGVIRCMYGCLNLRIIGRDKAQYAYLIRANNHKTDRMLPGEIYSLPSLYTTYFHH